MIIANQQARTHAVRRQQGLHTRVAAEEIIESCRGDKLIVEADYVRRLRIVQKQVVIQHRGNGSVRVFLTKLLQQQHPEIKFPLSAHRQQRNHVGLGIDLTTVIGLAVEMDSEARYHGQWTVKINQVVFQAMPCTFNTDPTGQGQVAVKPRVQQSAAVNFNTKLPVTIAVNLGLRFHLQTRAVRVRTDHSDTAFQQRLPSRAERTERRIVANDIIALPLLKVPAVTFVQLDETLLLQP